MIFLNSMKELLKRSHSIVLVLFVTAATVELAYSEQTLASANESNASLSSSLLDYLNEEARNMETFPVEYIAEVGDICKSRYLSCGKALGVFDTHYDLTFERYLPFYRFKTRAAEATVEELDYCVQHIEEQEPKTQALILTALYIYERIKRPALDENAVAERPRPLVFERIRRPALNENAAVEHYYPAPWGSRFNSVFLPEYRPDPTISQSLWNKWAKVVQGYRSSDKVAFSKLGEPFYFILTRGETGPEMRVEWLRAVERFYETIKSEIGDFEEKTEEAERYRQDYEKYFGGPVIENVFRDRFDNYAFLERSAEIAQDNSDPKREMALAIRDYWYTFQFRHETPERLWSDLPLPDGGNFSAFDLTLGLLADQLIRSRADYENDPCKDDPVRHSANYFFKWGIARSVQIKNEKNKAYLSEGKMGDLMVKWNLDDELRYDYELNIDHVLSPAVEEYLAMILSEPDLQKRKALIEATHPGIKKELQTKTPRIWVSLDRQTKKDLSDTTPPELKMEEPPARELLEQILLIILYIVGGVIILFVVLRLRSPKLEKR